MRTFIVAFLMLCCVSVLGIAQQLNEYGIVLSGVTSVDKIAGCCTPGEDGIAIWNVRLSLKFENTGLEPVILINPSHSYGSGLSQAELYFFDWNSSEKNEAGQITSRKYKLGNTQEFSQSPAEAESFRSLVELFASDYPTENFTFVLKPGESRSFEQEIPMRQKYTYKMVSPPKKSKRFDGQEFTFPAVTPISSSSSR